MTQGQYATKSQYDRLARKVDLLDQELILLKAQIQATLFAIQECILSSAYPSLGGTQFRTGKQKRSDTGTSSGTGWIRSRQFRRSTHWMTTSEQNRFRRSIPPLLLDEDLYHSPANKPARQAPAKSR
ncbi:MAG: hypothetical protein U0521_07655 [Anaerolineae bacterium]